MPVRAAPTNQTITYHHPPTSPLISPRSIPRQPDKSVLFLAAPSRPTLPDPLNSSGRTKPCPIASTRHTEPSRAKFVRHTCSCLASLPPFDWSRPYEPRPFDTPSHPWLPHYDVSPRFSPTRLSLPYKVHATNHTTPGHSDATCQLDKPSRFRPIRARATCLVQPASPSPITCPSNRGGRYTPPVARRRLLKITIWDRGDYWTAWQCPWCAYQWRMRPVILERCGGKRCGAIVEADGWVGRELYDDDTPVWSRSR